MWIEIQYGTKLPAGFINGGIVDVERYELQEQKPYKVGKLWVPMVYKTSVHKISLRMLAEMFEAIVAGNYRTETGYRFRPKKGLADKAPAGIDQRHGNKREFKPLTARPGAAGHNTTGGAFPARTSQERRK